MLIIGYRVCMSRKKKTSGNIGSEADQHVVLARRRQDILSCADAVHALSFILKDVQKFKVASVSGLILAAYGTDSNQSGQQIFKIIHVLHFLLLPFTVYYHILQQVHGEPVRFLNKYLCRYIA